MPAMRPFSSTNMPAATPISTPPASAGPGVKAFQSMAIAHPPRGEGVEDKSGRRRQAQ